MLRKPTAKVLLAATADGAREIESALNGAVELVAAHTMDDAVRLLGDGELPKLAIVSYHFDELRPCRFIQHVKEDPSRAHLPVLLVRALPMHLAAEGSGSVREAYVALGVTDVISLTDLKRELGASRAEQVFRESVLALVGRKLHTSN